MPQAKRAAATSEVKGKPRFVTVAKTKIQLNPTIPLRVMKDMSEIVKAGEDANLPDMVQALETVLDPEQMDKLWGIEVPATNGSTMNALQDLFGEAIDKVFTAYGITPGE